jgi:hypothetical protein
MVVRGVGLGKLGIAVKLPRLRISWVMVLVAIVGLNCWAIRTVLDYRSPIADRVGRGSLPMANILVLAPLVSYPYRGGRLFLWGLEVFGAAAVALYVAVTILDSTRPPFVISYLRLVTDPLIRAWGMPLGAAWTIPQLVIGNIIVSLWVSLPQLAFALIGGFLAHRLSASSGCRTTSPAP